VLGQPRDVGSCVTPLAYRVDGRLLEEVARLALQYANFANAAVVVKSDEDPDESLTLTVVPVPIGWKHPLNGLHINGFKIAVFLALDIGAITKRLARESACRQRRHAYQRKR